MTTTETRPHALYRFFAHDRALLYVGRTLNPGQRWPAHAHGQPWWAEVASATIETHPDLPSVVAAERAAIETERPRYNVMHASTRDRVETPVPAAVTEGRVPVKDRPVVALGLRDGRCPVGMVDEWADGWIELALFSWWRGEFGHSIRRYREDQVDEVLYANPETESGKREQGFPIEDMVWSCAPLARFQTRWQHAHGLCSDDDLRETLTMYAGGA